ncbi:MAG: glycosyl transferase [Candidatus Moraniibacteriota bacterium]|nr:MAG: glycosyl transferase [Candidatus Moranbacteria bacterium]
MEKSQIKKKKKKVAIVHDFLLYIGGAEKVLYDLTRVFPDAPVYTLLHDKEKIGNFLSDRDIRTSFLQKWPKFFRKKYRYLLPFFGTAIESFDLRDFDIIISSSGAWSKGIVTRLDTKHIAYVHSPMRYVWDENEHYLKKNTNIKNRFCTRYLLSYLRLWDHQAAQRPDVLIANSQYTQKRIKKYYRRDAHVLYPSVEINKIKKEKKDHFVIVSRLSRYKNVSLAVEVCNKLQLPLIVIGEGEEFAYLQKIAGSTITLKGWVSDEEKMKDIASARALLFPSEDDFGITPIEALCVGTPVIALARGGVKETVQGGVTGEFFVAPTVEMMADALRRFLEKEEKYDKKIMKKNITKYSFKNFKKEIENIVNQFEK